MKARALSYPSPLWGQDERSSLLRWHIVSAANDVSGGGSFSANVFQNGALWLPLPIGHLDYGQSTFWNHGSPILHGPSVRCEHVQIASLRCYPRRPRCPTSWRSIRPKCPVREL